MDKRLSGGEKSSGSGTGSGSLSGGGSNKSLQAEPIAARVSAACIGSDCSAYRGSPVGSITSHTSASTHPHTSAHPSAHPASHTSARLSVNPASHTSGHPASHTSGHPVSHTSAHQASHTSGRLSVNPASHTSGHPASHTSGRLSENPASHTSEHPLPKVRFHPNTTETGGGGRSTSRRQTSYHLQQPLQEERNGKVKFRRNTRGDGVGHINRRQTQYHSNNSKNNNLENTKINVVHDNKDFGNINGGSGGPPNHSSTGVFVGKAGKSGMKGVAAGTAAGADLDLPYGDGSDWPCCPIEENYCPEGCGPACSENPNCHTFMEPCERQSKLGPDYFPNPFRKLGVFKPDWLAHCGKVLRYYAFYQEPISESEIENYRIHQCEIRFFLDNGTIEVYEPKTFDPGFIQGILIQRHKIPLPLPPSPSYQNSINLGNSNYFTVYDLNVGLEVEFYAKMFFISGVDDLTRQYLNRLGLTVPQNIETPSDPYTHLRKDKIQSHFARRGLINPNPEKLRKFRTNRGKVLRFWSYWDDRCSGGDLKRYIIHYFLEDDSIEIKEITDPDGKIRGALSFLGRGKLLKNYKDLVPLPGMKEEAILVLNTNVGGPCVATYNHLADRLCPGIQEKEFVTDKDLGIGSLLNVYGRAFILTSCDKATENYYREKYGIEDFTPLELTGTDALQIMPRMEDPPHIGIGDEIDTLTNWDKLQPKPPRKDDIELLLKDKDILNFSAQLHNALNKVNQDRRFTIRIFMVDETLQIFEKAHPNTGIKQGTFLARTKVRKNTMIRFELGESSEYYKSKDYFVGNILDLNGFNFLFTDADEFTLNFMEQNKHVFPQSNLCLILDKLREAVGPLSMEELLSVFTQKDQKMMGIMKVKDLRAKLIFLTRGGLSEHEMITVIRAFRVDAPIPPPDMITLQKVIQTELERHNFEKHLLSRIEYTMRYHDPCRSGHIDRETLRTTLKGARLPVSSGIIDFLVDNFESADICNRVDYCSLMRYLDWVEHPVGKALACHESCVMKWLEPKPPAKVFCVNYHALLELLCPNIKCALPSVCSNWERRAAEEEMEERSGRTGRTEQPFPRDCDPYAEESDETKRERAGKVITDRQIRQEKHQCDDPFGFDPDSHPKMNWTSRKDFENVDPYLMEAYKPAERNDCFHLEGGRRELFRPGDFIAQSDLYGTRR